MPKSRLERYGTLVEMRCKYYENKGFHPEDRHSLVSTVAAQENGSETKKTLPQGMNGPRNRPSGGTRPNASGREGNPCARTAQWELAADEDFRAALGGLLVCCFARLSLHQAYESLRGPENES